MSITGLNSTRKIKLLKGTKAKWLLIALFVTQFGFSQYNEYSDWHIDNANLEELNLKGKIKKIEERIVYDHDSYSEAQIQKKYFNADIERYLRKSQSNNSYHLFFDEEGFFVELNIYRNGRKNFEQKYYYSNHLIDSVTSGHWTHKDFQKTTKADTIILSVGHGRFDYYYTENRILHKIIDNYSNRLKQRITYQDDGNIQRNEEFLGDDYYEMAYEYEDGKKMSKKFYHENELKHVEKFNGNGDKISTERFNHSTLGLPSIVSFYTYDEKNNWTVKIERTHVRKHKILFRRIEYY